MYSIQDRDLSLDIIPNFISPTSAEKFYEYLYAHSEWPYPFVNKDGTMSRKRNACIYGDIDAYKMGYKEGYSHKVTEWPEPLKRLNDYISSECNENLNVCIVQIYNDGRAQIKPHQDREIASGTKIISLSLGTTRVMRFERKGHRTHDILLESGTLCVMNPPTNDRWLHSIPILEGPDIGPRMSLVFRNCYNMM